MTIGIARPLGGGSGSAGSVSGLWKRGADTLAIGNSIGEGAYGLTTPSGTAWCQIPNGVANVNDIAHPSYRDLTKDHQIQLKCVQAGTIGTEEPEWPAVGQEIADGTARWVVERCTQAMNRNSGYFNIAMELLGWPLNLIHTVGCPGRRSDFIIFHAYRALQTQNPGIIFVADIFANDVSQLGGDMEAYKAAWTTVQTFLDAQIQSGRFVILQGASPSSSYNTQALRDGAAYFDSMLLQWSKRNQGASKFWHGASEITASLVQGQDWNPDDVTTYVAVNSVSDKITDGVHPLNVASWRMGKSLAKVIGELELSKRVFMDKGNIQRFDNPRNLGTSGSLGTGITGIVPTGWNTGRDGVAVGTSSLTLRQDGVQGYWWNLDVSSTDGGKVWAYKESTLAALGFSVGDRVDFIAEMVGSNMSTTAFCPRVEIAFWGAVEYPTFSSMLYTSGQPFGQAIGTDNLVQLVQPIPFALKVPVGTTNIAVSISFEGSGAWSGTFRLGRVNINNLSK